MQHNIFHNYFSNNKVMCNNFGWMYGEADVIAVTKSDLLVEYEIKLSKSDFKADFKKRAKHLRYSGIKHRRKGWLGIPNRFYYVTTPGLLELSDIPEYAGLIEIDSSLPDHCSAKTLKKAPLIHSDKCPNMTMEQIAHALTIRLVHGGSYVSWRVNKSRELGPDPVDALIKSINETSLVGAFRVNEAEDFFKNI